MELHEIQKADLGRKYAKVDRRPLDPPPVILLKIYEVHDAGTDRESETEMTYDDTQLLGLLCTVDLFPVPSPDILPSQPSRRTAKKTPASAPSNRTTFHTSPSPTSSSSGYGQDIIHYRYQPSTTEPSGPHVHGQGTTDIIHHLDGFPITESSKQTQALVGATFGKKAIVFVFADLAVKIEGTFILRYRVFDIFARHYTQELTITAEVYGGTFRVYSTKEFPGLAASTELTKLLARWGVRLNIRETERRRRRRPVSGERRSLTPE
ncbi:velvet factor [Pholiota molesta]|nr:velvet factor [Pholiota molesta]